MLIGITSNCNAILENASPTTGCTNVRSREWSVSTIDCTKVRSILKMWKNFRRPWLIWQELVAGRMMQTGNFRGAEIWRTRRYLWTCSTFGCCVLLWNICNVVAFCLSGASACLSFLLLVELQCSLGGLVQDVFLVRYLALSAFLRILGRTGQVYCCSRFCSVTVPILALAMSYLAIGSSPQFFDRNRLNKND